MSDSTLDPAPVRNLLQTTLRYGENEDEILTAVMALGRFRAELLGQQETQYDRLCALTILCKNPFKPPESPSNRAYLDQNRQRIVEIANYQPYSLGQVVSRDLCTMSLDEIFDVLQNRDLRNYWRLG